MQGKSRSYFIYYMGYGFLLTLALLYFRFPTEEFRKYCEGLIVDRLPFEACSIKETRFSFPFTIILNQLNLQQASDETLTSIAIDQLSLQPTLKFWNTYTISGKAYSGTLNSKLKVNWTEQKSRLTDTVAIGLNVSEILTDQAITSRQITGTLDGSATFDFDWKKPSESNGKARLALTSGNFDLLQPVLSLTEISFSKIVFDMSLAEQIEIQQGKLKGENVNATFEGSVDVLQSLQGSRLNLTGLLEPKRDFLQSHPLEAKMVKQYTKRSRKNNLPFKMGGTLANPTFRFSR